MGIDACIYIKARTLAPRLEHELPDGFSLKPNPKGYGHPGATHEVDNLARFYGPTYARGPWPLLSGVLMLLLNSPDIETVWYCGDSGHVESMASEPWTLEKQEEFTRYFVQHGRREYVGDWQ